MEAFETTIALLKHEFSTPHPSSCYHLSRITHPLGYGLCNGREQVLHQLRANTDDSLGGNEA